MEIVRCKRAASVPSLEALGAADAQAVLSGNLSGLSRSEVLDETPSYRTLRLPLPGTPQAPGGGLTGRPMGIGTGWLRLRLYRGLPFWSEARARLRSPGGASPAEREWNLLCALRAGGCATLEPLAVVAEAGGARRSALILRDADAGPDLAQFRGQEPAAILGLGEALAQFTRRLSNLGAVLPELTPKEVRIAGMGAEQTAELAEDSCALEQIAAARAQPKARFEPGLSLRVLPSLILLGAPLGWLERRPTRAAWAAFEQAVRCLS